MSDASSEGSVAHDGVSEEEERTQSYTVPIGRPESISFQKKRHNLDSDYAQPATLWLVTAYIALPQTKSGILRVNLRAS